MSMAEHGDHDAVMELHKEKRTVAILGVDRQKVAGRDRRRSAEGRRLMDPPQSAHGSAAVGIEEDATLELSP
jgi:hypothetical protein